MLTFGRILNLKMKKWSSKWTQFMQLRKEAWKKFKTSREFEPVTSRSPLRCSTNWATDVGSRSIVDSYVPVSSFLSREHMNPQLTCSQRHSSVNRASHRYPEVTGSNPVEVLNFFQASSSNCINCVHCDDHFFIFISFPQFIYDLFHISLTILNFLIMVYLISVYFSWFNYQTTSIHSNAFDTGVPRSNCNLVIFICKSIFH